MPYTRAGLAQAANDAGLGPVKERLITEWVERGLLDQGERTSHGRGGGRGALYLWSDRQHDLFLTLLRKRPEVKNIASLCPIPVGIWLYWGDDWIPLRQARIALRTWWDGAGRGGEARSLANARLVVNAFASKAAPRQPKTDLRKALRVALDAGTFDVALIEGLVTELLQHGPGKGTWGPFGSSPREVVNGMRAMVVAMSRYDQLTDGMFYEVRARNRTIVLSYLRDWQHLSQNETYGSMFEQPSIELWMNNSCGHLSIELGLKLIALDDGVELPPVELHPANAVTEAFASLPIR